MTTINVQLPDSLHKMAHKLAKEEGVSVNQLVPLALAEKLSALATETYLEERARRGNRASFLAAMAKVSDAEPFDEQDRL
jgi:hypothetical protein